jgi:RimJ/RimL family protein N-acetyltransferase
MINKTSIILATLCLISIICYIMYRTKHKTDSYEEPMSPWLASINKNLANRQSGSFTGVDKSGTSVIFEWSFVNARSPKFFEISKSLADFIALTWTPIEVDYLKANPSEAEKNPAIKQFFANGIQNVDWQQVETSMAQFLKEMMESDPCKSPFWRHHDSSLFVIAKEKETGNMLGFIQFIFKNSYPQGSVNLGNLGVASEARNRGLGKLFTSLLYKLLPQTERIFLYVRPTNKAAQAAYLAYGFVHNQNPVADPMFADMWLFEYISSQKDILQEAATRLQ